MIKFFQKKRYNLITDNSGKYIRYAIGEIVLVVIGILIALQINYWDLHRQDLAEEQKILLQLKSEYEKNLVQLEEKIKMRINIIAEYRKILSLMDGEAEDTTYQIFLDMYRILQDPTFDPIQNDILNSGKIRLVRNDNLSHLISNWSSDLLQVKELEQEWKKIRTEIVIPFTIKSGISRDINNLLWKDGYSPEHALDKGTKVVYKINESKVKPDINKLLN